MSREDEINAIMDEIKTFWLNHPDMFCESIMKQCIRLTDAGILEKFKQLNSSNKLFDQTVVDIKRCIIYE